MNGSVQGISEVPEELKKVYRTVWEIPQKSLLELAAERGAYIDQSQSFNVYFQNPSVNKVLNMHFYGWKKGLKTGKIQS